MTFDIDVELPAAKMYNLFTKVDYWQDLVGFYRENAARTEIEHFSSDDTGTHVTFAHIMSGQDLPPIARPVLPGTFVVTREQHFEPFHTDTNQALGRYLAHIPAPVELTGDYVLADTPADLIRYEPLALHIVSHIPEHHRITTWTVERDSGKEALMLEKVKHARKYFAEVVAEFERTHPDPAHVLRAVDLMREAA
jgi:hypothetical protein